MERVCGMPIFDYLAQHPQEAAQFSEAMVGIHGAEPPAVAAAYDFSRVATIVDVGAAPPRLLGHILEPAPSAPRRPVRSPSCDVRFIRRRLLRRRPVEAGLDRTAASSTAFPRAATPTSCRTSFTIGTRISA